MDFHLLLFFSVILIIFLEMGLSAKWSPFYFKKGIQLYAQEINFGNDDYKLDEIPDILNKSFKGTGYSPSINFNIIDSQTVGFREKIFEFSLFNYTPIMHGKIEFSSNKIQVVGISNWFPIGFFALWYSSILPGFRFDIDIIFLLAPVLIFGVIYIMQWSRYNKIVNQLFDIKDKSTKQT